MNLGAYATLGLFLLISCAGSLSGAYLFFRRKSFANQQAINDMASSIKKIEDSLAKEEVKNLAGWDQKDWLTYYAACREFLLALGAKFVMLMTQASVYASAACAAMLALHHEFASAATIRREIYVILSGPLILPLLVYWYFLVRYFYQTRETGSVMKDIEASFTSVESRLRLLGRLREKKLARLYGAPLTVVFVWLYPPLLAFAIFAIGYCLSYGLPSWILAKPS